VGEGVVNGRETVVNGREAVVNGREGVNGREAVVEGEGSREGKERGEGAVNGGGENGVNGKDGHGEEEKEKGDVGATQCIWLARVRPEDCEGIVKFTVLQGKVVKPERQLRGGFDREKGLLSW
jgi:hypothetical protein